MTTPDNALIDLRALAEAAKDWAITDFWPEAIAEDDDDLGVTVIGHIDEDGDEYPVAVIDADTYGTDGESVKLAKFYAAANPVTVLGLLDRIASLEAKLSQAQAKPNPWQQAVDAELVNAHLGIAGNVSYADAAKTLHALICWNVEVATNPKTNGGLSLQPTSQAQAVPDGWRLVPVEMSNAMGLAGQLERKQPHSSLACVYRAMLAASPTPPASKGLSKEAIADIAEQVEALDPNDSIWVELTRLIEAAHGIQGEGK